MSKSLDIYVIERRAGEIILAVGLWAIRATVLGCYRLGDARRFVTRGAR